jgi:F0F1-type ATP synthase, alpha subunit
LSRWKHAGFILPLVIAFAALVAIPAGAMLTFMRDTRKDVLDAIKEKKVIDEAVEKALTEAITAFKQGWKA